MGAVQSAISFKADKADGIGDDRTIGNPKVGIDQTHPARAVEFEDPDAMPTGLRVGRKDGGGIAILMMDRPGRLAGESGVGHPVDVDSVA